MADSFQYPDPTIRLTVDAVVFGYHSEQLHVLLIRRKYEPFINQWALPGGFVTEQESLEQAVERELSEETGLTISYLEQLFSFGNPQRDPRFRVVSVAYMAIIRSGNHELRASTDAIDAQWFDVNQLPSLAFDHAQILEKAIQRLRSKLRYQPIGFDLLPEKFLFGELEKLYSIILNQPLDRRNFRKKMLSFGILEELSNKVSEGRGRPASLYRFDTTRYQELELNGFYFDIP
ncbi:MULTISPECIES: NrtR DNA-binding winged helix domain-containing protein [unclassified Siphonobacter]|uniref:NUDIX hydrolase n=1 Tax=unclassified Siphonobacter TaxID=2635712 RepID=UPI000CB29687|nr:MULTISPECIES: NUDIX domain-containing protein [unclassified Siphonobacter]MDQ1086952.1 8-oxo-dGTP diphosphatase [Siphonobacter sp. SORGH_AS_1065]MDR6193062.1 8-oxo-dGTP diphosphatase [Siphonobacter sp. SORGH_AS_0500]PKK35664.1 NUDIX hydrolase [Siphonobacter sp. SORGH_AS_0500]